METVYVNGRCRKILKYLLRENGYISLQQIADKVAVSKRSIYYDLCKINEWLSFYELQEIEVQRSKGILLSGAAKSRIETLLLKENPDENYIFAPMERVKIIICYIIYCGVPVYIERLTEYCQVSRNTIFNDLRVIVGQLQEYNLALIYESKQGYQIDGDIIRIRALFFLYFSEIKPLFDTGVLNFTDHVERESHIGKLQNIEKELNTKYVDGVLFALSSLLPLMYKSKEKPYFPSLKEAEIKKSLEFILILKYFPDLEKSEQLYLCLHLLGSRVAGGANEIFDRSADQTVYTITKALVAEFEKIACVIFEDKEGLERSLFMHISTSLYRYQYGIQIGDPMSLDVVREYPSLVGITKLVSKYLVKTVGLPIPDSEVAYLALHFGAHLKISKTLTEHPRILIFCVNGVSTGNMLRREIRRLLPNAVIVDVVTAVDIMNIQDICDFVISTVQLKCEVPVLVVHPILTASDRRSILNHVNSAGQNSQPEMPGSFLKLPGVIELLQEVPVLIVEQCSSWQEAIWLAGEPLVANKIVERKYLDTIISQIQYYGPYMFIADGVVLAHAKPEDGVNRLGVGFAVFKEKIMFSDIRNANIIITLAAQDQEGHLKVLEDIMDIFAENSHSRIEEIMALTDGAEVTGYLQRLVKRE